MPVVPIFHANGWGFSYAATFVGAKQVFPSVHTDPKDIAEPIIAEDVTTSAAVPTIWLEMANYLNEHPGMDIANIDRLLVCGSAPLESLIRKYDQECDAPILQGRGMTETTPAGTISQPCAELENAMRTFGTSIRRKLDCQFPAFNPEFGMKRVRESAA